MYQNFSLKWIFISVVSTFEIGSLICGVAPSSTVFIVGRAIAGLGAGGIFAGALTIIAYSIPLRKRPIYAGCIGAMFGVCPGLLHLMLNLARLRALRVLCLVGCLPITLHGDGVSTSTFLSAA